MAADAADAAEESRVQDLLREFPDATRAELLRFSRARKDVHAATSMFANHQAYLAANPPAKLAEAYRKVSDRFVRACPGCAVDGTGVLLVQGARYDKEPSAEEHVLAVLHVLLRSFNREDTQKWTVLVDIRTHEGWPNLPAGDMVPFFRQFSSMLSANFPERCQRIIIYPVPPVVWMLWMGIKRFLPGDIKKTIEIIGGEGGLGAACPKELGSYLTQDAVPEDARHMFQELPAGATLDERIDVATKPPPTKPAVEAKVSPKASRAGERSPRSVEGRTRQSFCCMIRLSEPRLWKKIECGCMAPASKIFK